MSVIGSRRLVVGDLIAATSSACGRWPCRSGDAIGLRLPAAVPRAAAAHRPPPPPMWPPSGCPGPAGGLRRACRGRKRFCRLPAGWRMVKSVAGRAGGGAPSSARQRRANQRTVHRALVVVRALFVQVSGRPPASGGLSLRAVVDRLVCDGGRGRRPWRWPRLGRCGHSAWAGRSAAARRASWRFGAPALGGEGRGRVGLAAQPRQLGPACTRAPLRTSCSASASRRCPIIATTTWLVSRRSRGQ